MTAIIITFLICYTIYGVTELVLKATTIASIHSFPRNAKEHYSWCHKSHCVGCAIPSHEVIKRERELCEKSEDSWKRG